MKLVAILTVGAALVAGSAHAHQGPMGSARNADYSYGATGGFWSRPGPVLIAGNGPNYVVIPVPSALTLYEALTLQHYGRLP